MRLFAVGVSHRTAPVELRETVDFARRGLPLAIEALRARNPAREAVVLSPCNRAGSTRAPTDAAADRQRYRRVNGVDWQAIEPHLVVPRPRAASHLFRVAAGADLLVVGEPQILDR